MHASFNIPTMSQDRLVLPVVTEHTQMLSERLKPIPLSQRLWSQGLSETLTSVTNNFLKNSDVVSSISLWAWKISPCAEKHTSHSPDPWSLCLCKRSLWLSSHLIHSRTHRTSQINIKSHLCTKVWSMVIYSIWMCLHLWKQQILLSQSRKYMLMKSMVALGTGRRLVFHGKGLALFFRSSLVKEATKAYDLILKILNIKVR